MISNAYAQAASTANSDGGWLSFVPIVVMFAVLYFLMIRPQMKRQKEQKAMIEALAKNDEVMTSGGILGTIVKISGHYVTLQIADNTEMIVQKTAITMLLPKGTIKAI